jgi:excisionase family DNA binding protein
MNNRQVPTEQAQVKLWYVHAGRTYYRALHYGLLNINEAAEVLGVTTRSVWNLVKKRKLRARRRSGRVVFPLSEVRAFRSAVNRRSQP